jgi:hypothetical protein
LVPDYERSVSASAELLHVLTLPDFDRPDAIGAYWGNPKTRPFAEVRFVEPRTGGTPSACSPRRAKRGRTPRAGPKAGPRMSELGYGVILEIRVYQLASAVRVAPQLPIGAARYCDSVQVCPMNSDATQMSLPTVTAIP